MGLSLGKVERRPNPTATPPWSDLPPELAGLVLCRLLSHVDRLRFRAVCRQWRLAAQQPQPQLPAALPWLRLSGLTFQSLPGGELLRFTDPDLRASAACIGCVDGWLLCDRYNRDNTHTRFLANPFTGAAVETPACCFGYCVHTHGVDSTEFLLRKVVVCSPDLVAASLFGSTVGFYRPGAHSWSVCSSPDPRREWYTDVAFHRGKLYALSTKEELFVHDISDDEAAGVSNKAAAHVKHIIKAQTVATNLVDSDELSNNMRYLVASCNELLMVRVSVPPRVGGSGQEGSYYKLDEENIEVKVFQADLVERRWLEVKNLDAGQALFVGSDCSKAVRLSGDDKRFQGNRVYILGVDLATCCPETKRADIPSYGFYDLGNRSFSQVFLNGRCDTRHLYSSTWFFPCM